MNGEKLISYKVIVAAKAGDSDAMRQILRHYEPYIIRCSQRTFFDEYGNQYQVVDEEIKNRIQAKLMYQLIYDFDPFKLPFKETQKKRTSN